MARHAGVRNANSPAGDKRGGGVVLSLNSQAFSTLLVAVAEVSAAAARSVAAAFFAPASVVAATRPAASVLARLGLVHRQRTPLIIRSVKRVDSRLSFGVV